MPGDRRAERSNIDVALAWCAAHDPHLGVQIVNRFGWTWVVLGDGTAGAARVRNALVDDAPARDRAAGLLLAGWLEASAGNVTLAQDDLDRARALGSELADELLIADVDRHQAFLSIQQGRPSQPEYGDDQPGHVPVARVALADRREPAARRLRFADARGYGHGPARCRPKRSAS